VREAAAAKVTLVMAVSTVRNTTHAKTVMSAMRPVEPSWSTSEASWIRDDCPVASTAPRPEAPTTAAAAKPVVISRRMNAPTSPVAMLVDRRAVRPVRDALTRRIW
jgi:hypothetical protein